MSTSVGDGKRVGNGIVTSRSWGHGAVLWEPGQVKARVVVPGHEVGPAERTLLVATKKVDQDGRLKPLEITLIVEGGITGLQIKQKICTHAEMPSVGSTLVPDRMSLTIFGAELADDCTLSSVAPTAALVQARLQIRRRGAEGHGAEGTPTAPQSPSLSKVASSRFSSPVKRATKTSPGSPEKSRCVLPPHSLTLRCLLGGVGKPVEVQTSGDMDVATLRAMVATLPIALQASRDDPTAGALAKKDPKASPAETEVTLDKLVLLGEGIDLEIASEIASSGGAGLEAGGEAAEEGARDGAAPEGLVHLRDGHLLSAYGLKTGSLLYLIIEGKQQPAE
jgi:hypothetical protein